MWNPFRKNNKDRVGQSPSSAQQANRVDALANTLRSEGRVKELERELAKLDLLSLSASEQESWWHLYGITAFQEGRDSEALERFEKGYEKFPNSAQIRFSLGQQYLRARRIEEAFTLFRTCQFPEIPREYALAQARYAYLWGRYDDGLCFIQPFLAAYKQLRILDDHFLYVRGLPFFGRWWSYLAAFSILAGDTKELEEVTKFVSKKCYDYDFESLNAELVAYRDNDPGLLLAPLEGRLHALPVANFQTAYLRMSVAVIKARTAPTLEAAQAVLLAEALSDEDSPWLKDVRTLALAEAANRFGNAALENEQVEAFLAHQPMLFEPDIALNFHLLRYQEHLKPRASAR